MTIPSHWLLRLDVSCWLETSSECRMNHIHGRRLARPRRFIDMLFYFMFPSRRNLGEQRIPHPYDILHIRANERQFNESDTPGSTTPSVSPPLPSTSPPKCPFTTTSLVYWPTPAHLATRNWVVGPVQIATTSSRPLPLLRTCYPPSKQQPSRVGRLLRAWWFGITPDWAMGTQGFRLGGQTGTSDSDSIWDGRLRVMLDV